MAQASIAQREPSMEEILASIRRIIEDSDAPARASEEADLTDVAALRAEAANLQPADGPARDEDAFRVEFESEEDTAEIPETFQEHAAAFEAPPAIEAEVETDRLPEPPNERYDAAPAAPAPIRQEAAAPAQDWVPATASRSAILSETASRQVAAAFDELSVARFAATRTRSFDEMAEEMLRPMLQDWLDNNLPTMVERLVREEIERIARGGTR
jgi:uncharacterized protein